MNESMASAAQQYDDAERLPIFTDEDVETAINQATSPEQQYAQIEKKYGIDQALMQRLEETFFGITQEALVPSKKPSLYQTALKELLDMVEETLIMNQKTMPYEHPKLPTKLPLRVAKIIFPDFEPTKVETAKEADIMAEMKKIAIHNSPEAMKERAQKEQNLANFFKEEERRISDPQYGEKMRLQEQAAFEKALKEYRAEKPDDVMTSVKGDIQSLLKGVSANSNEGIDLSDEDIEVVFEEAPPTVKEGRKTA